MYRLVAAVGHLLDGFCRLGGLAAGAMIAACAVIITYEVMARYLFNAPTIWVNEYSVYLLVASTFLALGHVAGENAHIRVEMLTSRLPQRVQWAVEAVATVLGLAFSVLLVLAGWEKMATAYRLNMTAPTLLHTPMFIPKAVVPIGAAFLAMQLLRRLVLLILALAGQPVALTTDAEDHRM